MECRQGERIGFILSAIAFCHDAFLLVKTTVCAWFSKHCYMASHFAGAAGEACSKGSFSPACLAVLDDGQGHRFW